MNNSKLIATNLIGRPYWQAPIMAARIDCDNSVAHNLTAVKAIESACGIEVSSQTKKLRELILAAEIIKNHTIHLYFEVLPEFLGLSSSDELAKLHPELFRDAVDLEHFANNILATIGGRATHPITSVVGGFKSYSNFQFVFNGDVSPRREASPLRGTNVDATKTLRLFSSFDLPVSESKSYFAALHLDNDYAFYNGEIWTSKGDVYTADRFLEFADKWGCFSPKRSVPMTIGSLARYNLNQSHFNKEIKGLLSELNIEKKLLNPAEVILAKAIEIYYFVILSVDLLDYFGKARTKDEHVIPPRKFSAGSSAVESADGIIIHHYELDKAGMIVRCEIFTPNDFNSTKKHFQK